MKLDRSTRDFPHGVLLLSEHPTTTKKKKKGKKKDGVAGATLPPVEQCLVRGYIYLDKNEKNQKNEEKN